MRAAKIKTEIRKDQIATAALDLMARHGPKSLNLANLARKVGLVPSAIYRHYPGKDAVLDSVLDLIADRLQANVQAVRLETPDALERLHRLLDRHVQLIQNHATIPRVVFAEETFSGHAKRREHVCEIVQGYLAQVARIVREGQRDAHIQPDLPAGTVSVMFLGLIHPAIILWLTSAGKFDVGAHARQAWPLFRNLLQRRPDPSAPTPRFPDRHGPAGKNRNRKH